MGGHSTASGSLELCKTGIQEIEVNQFGTGGSVGADKGELRYKGLADK